MYQLFNDSREERGYLKKWPTFSFRGKTSQDFDILVTSLGEREAPEQERDEISVPLSDKAHLILYPYHKPYTRSLEIAFNEKDRSPIFSWLKGYGVFETSRDNGHFFMASVMNISKPSTYRQGFLKSEVAFLVDPYAFLFSGRSPIVCAESMELVNPGTWYAKPLIEIVASGSFQMSINNKTFAMHDLDGTVVTVDSDLRKAYSDGKNVGQLMEGEFPWLKPGTNQIDFIALGGGEVKSVKITPRWCDL